MLTYEQAEKYEDVYHASLAQKFDEGIEKGVETVAKNMLTKGIYIEIIDSVTGLTAQEVKNISSSTDKNIMYLYFFVDII